MKVQAIIPTAGLGLRLQSDVPKPLIRIQGKPLCVYVLEVFEQAPEVNSVILVVHRSLIEEFKKNIKEFHLKKVIKVVSGGETRKDSVANGLKVVDEDTDYVMVHDGARPFVTIDMIKASLKACLKTGAAIVAVPVKSTIKRVDAHHVLETIAREQLWEVQTPQAFKKDILVKAHTQGITNATDDAMLVEQLGVSVAVVEGHYRNIKVTTQEDICIAEAFLRS